MKLNFHPINRLVLFTLFAVFLLGRRDEYRLSHDFSSYVLPALAQNHKLGEPYTDYFINRPPMIFSFIGYWGDLLGYQYLSWILLEFACLCIIILSLNSIFSHVLTDLNRHIFLFFTALTLLFSSLIEMFLPSELIGLTFILAACAIASKTQTPAQLNFYVASSLILFAAFVREQFFVIAILFTLTVALFALAKRDRKIILATMYGNITTIFLVFVYFIRHQNFGSFWDIFYASYSKEKSKLSNYFVWTIDASDSIAQLFLYSSFYNIRNVYSSISILCLASLFLLFIKIIWSDISSSTINQWKSLVIGQIGLGLIFATGWQSKGNRFGGHYGLPTFAGLLLILSTLLFFFGLFQERFLRSKRIVNFITLFFALFLLVPSSSTYETFFSSMKNISLHNLSMKFQSDFDAMTYEEKFTFELIQRSTTDLECTMQVYGWGTASWYYYTRSTPCSRYFLINLLADNESFSEYRNSLQDNPPLAISYGCLQPQCADLEYQAFEERGFPFRRVLNQCYDLVLNRYPYFKREGLYVARMRSKIDQSSCIQNVLSNQDNTYFDSVWL
jgi:hypothetical protein